MKSKILFAFFILFISCNNVDKSIEGNWYYISGSDSSYNELYFSKELFLYNLKGGFVGQVYRYEIIGDSLFISTDNFGEVSEFMFIISSIKINNIKLIGGNTGELIDLKPISSKVNVWKGLHLQKNSIEDLTEGWFIRSSNFIHRENADSDEDSLIVLPPVIEEMDSLD